jgi:hypothetical protein
MKSFNFPGPHAAGAPLVLPMDVFPWAMAQWGAWKEGAGLKGWSFMGFWEIHRQWHGFSGTLWGFHVFFFSPNKTTPCCVIGVRVYSDLLYHLCLIRVENLHDRCFFPKHQQPICASALKFAQQIGWWHRPAWRNGRVWNRGRWISHGKAMEMMINHHFRGYRMTNPIQTHILGISWHHHLLNIPFPSRIPGEAFNFQIWGAPACKTPDRQGSSLGWGPQILWFVGEWST